MNRMCQRTFFIPSQRVKQFLLGGGLLALSVAFAAATVRLNVQVGCGGVVREATWFPIQCELSNDGPPLSGFIEVAPMGIGRGAVQRVPIELPTGTLKRVAVPVFAAVRYQTSWEVRLVDAHGRTLEASLDASARQAIGATTLLAASLSRTATGAISLRPIKRNQPDAQPQAVRWLPATFPGNPLLLDGVDAIYLNSTIATSLRPDQADALLAWTRAGGHLIVAIEQVNDITGTAWLQAVLPFVPQDIVSVTEHQELQTWLERNNAAAATTAGGDVRTSPSPPVPMFADLHRDETFERAEIRVARGVLRDGRIEVSSGGLPLLISAPRDFGRVSVLTFSPELEPFKSWSNLATFWTQLVGVPAALYTSTDYYLGATASVDGVFGGLIDSRQIHKLPVGWLLVLLVVYLAVIGPFDRWWLRKIKRPMLTWITFPVYVVLFSLLIYGLGYWLRAGESEYNELHVVDVCAHGARAELRGRTYASIYAPANRNYGLRSELPFATLRTEFTSRRGGESSESGQVVQTGDNFEATVFVPVWTSQLYLSDWWSAMESPLVATLENDVVTVRNVSGKPMSDAYMVWNEKVVSLGNLPTDEARTVWLEDPAVVHETLEKFVRRDLGAFLTAVRQRQRAFGSTSSGQISDPARAATVVSLLGSMSGGQRETQFTVPRGLSVAAPLAAGEAVLFAFATNSAPVPPLITSHVKRTTVDTLWRVPVTINERK